MLFAKLFTYPTGQLLVQWENSEAEEDEAAPYLVVTKTIGPGGVTVRLAHSYRDEATRDADFERFDEEKALKFFTSQHHMLAQMAG